MELIGVFFIVAVFVLGMIMMRSEGYSDGYMQGQIDALNGKIKYRKEENEDGETVWTEIENP